MAFTDQDRALLTSVGNTLGGVNGTVNDVNTKLSTARGTIDGINSAIKLPNPAEKLGDAFGKVFGGSGGGIVNIKGLLEEFFKDTFADLVDDIVKALPDDAIKELSGLAGKVIEKLPKEAIEEIAKLFTRIVKILEENGAKVLEELLKALTQLFETVVSILESLEQSAAKTLTKLTEAAQKLLSKIADVIRAFFEKVFKDGDILDVLPFSLRQGPLEALNSLEELGQFLKALSQERVDRVVRRIELVQNSLKQLHAIVTENSSFDFIFEELVEKPTEVLTKIINGTKPEKALREFILDILDPTDVLKDVQKAFTIKNFLKWLQLPGAVPVGKLNDWLNDASTYLPSNAPGAPQGAIDPVERQYRAKLVAEIDAYIRRTDEDSDKQQLLSRIDERDSTGILIDLVCLFFDTSIAFTLEPECYPLIEADWDNFEDIGFNVGKLVARQIRAAIRVTVGSVLQGFWAWNVYNVNLREGVPVIVGSIFTPILEGIIKNIALSVEVLSVYPKAKFPAAQLPNAFEFHRWTSLDSIGNSLAADDRLEYVAFIRNARLDGDLTPVQKSALKELNKTWKQNNPLHRHLKGLVEDIGAYLDVSYQRFRVDVLFPKLELPQDPGFNPYDTVSVLSKNFNPATRMLTIEARSAIDVGGALPRPILRLYHPCGVIVLSPEQQDYKVSFKIDGHRRSIPITILSSRGGTVTERIALP